MNEIEARNILQCWIKCPHAFGDVDYCKKDNYCEGGCWSRKQVKEAVLKLLEGSGSIQVMDCTGCIHKGNKQFCLNCKRGGCRDYYLVDDDIKIAAGKCSHMDIESCDECNYGCDFAKNRTDN